MIYTVFLDDKKIGTSLLESADAPMGCVWGQITFAEKNLDYNFFSTYCKNNGVKAEEDPEYKFISTQTIPTLKVLNQNNVEIKGVGCYIAGMDEEGFEINIIGIPYPFYGEEFAHHRKAYDDQFPPTIKRKQNSTKKISMVIALILIGSVVFWFIKNQGKATPEQTNTTYNKSEAENFVKHLDELGYFKYAAFDDIVNLKQNIITNYDPNSELPTLWDEATRQPKDYRVYFCDGEDVFEQGGIADLLNDLQPTFTKLNFTCEVTNHVEVWDDKNKWLNHKITINGTEYIIFKNFTEAGWGEAPMRIAEILNIELTKQNINEKIYLASGGNDGRLLFLTDELYKYIYSVYKNPHWKPLDLNEWAEVMDVKPMKY